MVRCVRLPGSSRLLARGVSGRGQAARDRLDNPAGSSFRFVSTLDQVTRPVQVTQAVVFAMFRPMLMLGLSS